MKQSHITTPRSLSECYFDPRGSAIEKPLVKHFSILAILWSMFTNR